MALYLKISLKLWSLYGICVCDLSSGLRPLIPLRRCQCVFFVCVCLEIRAIHSFEASFVFFIPLLFSAVDFFYSLSYASLSFNVISSLMLKESEANQKILRRLRVKMLFDWKDKDYALELK